MTLLIGSLVFPAGCGLIYLSFMFFFLVQEKENPPFKIMPIAALGFGICFFLLGFYFISHGLLLLTCDGWHYASCRIR